MIYEDYKKLLNLTVKIGAQLMENGAETYRVEQSIFLILQAFKIKHIDVFAITSYISVTITLDDDESLTTTKRIYARNLDLEKIHHLNTLCRALSSKKECLETVEKEIQKINCVKKYSLLVHFLAFGVVAFSFCLFFGGNIFDSIIAFFCGLTAKLIIFFTDKFNSNTFFSNILAAFFLSVVALVCVKFNLALHSDKIITGTLMLLVPGVLITNSMRDIISGDTLSGILKLLEAFLVATAIALGVGIAITLYRYITFS